MPIEERIIEAYLYTLFSEGVNVLANEVTTKGGVGNLEIGILGIKKTKALVMLGGEYYIFHTRLFSRSCPLLCIKKVGVEVLKVLAVLLLSD